MTRVEVDAVDEAQLILCCAFCCANISTYPGVDCFGCSGKVRATVHYLPSNRNKQTLTRCFNVKGWRLLLQCWSVLQTRGALSLPFLLHRLSAGVWWVHNSERSASCLLPCFHLRTSPERRSTRGYNYRRFDSLPHHRMLYSAEGNHEPQLSDTYVYHYLPSYWWLHKCRLHVLFGTRSTRI